MKMKTLFFEPLDVLMFRDHRPFDAGLHHAARGIFPAPSVLLGCLRTALFLRAGADFQRRPGFGLDPTLLALLGDNSQPGALRLRGPLLATRSEQTVDPYFAPPQDLELSGTDHPEPQRYYQRLLPLPKDPRLATTLHLRGDVPWESPGRLPFSSEPKDQPGAPIYLTAAGARRVLGAEEAGTLVSGDYVITQRLYREELRTGIARDQKTLAVEDHMLYSKTTWRLASDAGFAVEVDASDDRLWALVAALHHQIVPLGGKGHRARIHVSDKPLLAGIDPPGAPEQPRRRAWFVTPAVLERDPRESPQVVSFAMATPQMLGGYDLALRQPKPLRRAAPAGTVLFLSQDEPAPWRLLRAHGQQTQDEDHRAGYGVALFGRW